MDESQRQAAPRMLTGSGIMFLSAALFGYFGFFTGSWSHAAGGQVIPAWVLLDWTIKASAVVFLLSAVLTLVRPLAGNLIYCVGGLISALAFLAVLGLYLLDRQHPPAIHPVLLLIFAAWNGYGSFIGLKLLRDSGRR